MTHLNIVYRLEFCLSSFSDVRVLYVHTRIRKFRGRDRTLQGNSVELF